MRIDVNERYHLSPLVTTDRARLVAFLNDREIFDRTLRIPYPYQLEDADRFLKIARDAESRHGHPIHFAIRNEAAELMGALGFEDLVRGHRAEIGYWLGKPFWRQGIMTEVVAAACRFAAAEWELVRIDAEVFDFNLGSARVLEKNGFQFEGLLSKVVRKGDRFIDCKLFALVR